MRDTSSAEGRQPRLLGSTAVSAQRRAPRAPRETRRWEGKSPRFALKDDVSEGKRLRMRSPPTKHLKVGDVLECSDGTGVAVQSKTAWPSSHRIERVAAQSGRGQP